jgi:uncharacterized protein YegL
MNPKQGDYVLATKYGDGDPKDHWAVGFYSHFDQARERHFIMDSKGRQFRANGFRRVKKISSLRGQFILDHADLIGVSRRSLWWWVRTSMHPLSAS